MKIDQLDTVMLRIATRLNLDSSYSSDKVESVAHELAHAIDLGDPTLSSRDVGNMVRRMTGPVANAHEVRVLRIEVESLRRLGVRSIDGPTLFADAAFFGGKTRCPSPRQMKRPLTMHEARAVNTFVRIVRKEARTK